MSLRKWIRQHENMIASEGGVVLKVEARKHVHFRIRTPFGERVLTISGTTVDPHSFYNNRSIVRRLMKGIGK